ncbi:Sulfite exporter TauE/SafE [Rosistilla carotiformis]|uniref:Probable membrane transporter protein n=1 Tax=Rosistilla carotiformis TaxID=2528017 RepID=A0A518JTN6_9BACT|nr:sulfite exporter TauE/SafE family protein [Rosistilla carotiformis]QDV68910.1 Sulfite exporter TauE/SafE [Rosistilla carotiformis]
MQSLKKMWPFGLWLVAFYCVWLGLVTWGNEWSSLRSHWPIAMAMALGSYVAGSTPMGGGTVGFPVLVLWFDMPGSLGRNFGLAVQSIGMVSASVYILSARRPIDCGLLRPAILGALIGTPLGAALIAPYVPDLWIKLTFAVIWCSFGILHLIKLRELVQTEGVSDLWRGWDRWIGLTLGVTGGIIASLTGVGIDMLIYATLVLLYRADLKIAIPTSVVIMAVTSVIGITSNAILARINPSLYFMDPEVYANWLAAAPIVALGAPFGALIVNLISRTPTLLAVSTLCILQFVWTIIQEGVTGLALAGAVGAVLAVNGLFHLLYQCGNDRPILEDLPFELPNGASSIELADIED